ncbi:hypothetical protein D3C87_1244210 [compost metagenome]
MFARLHDFHQLAERVETAGKTAVGVELHQYFFRFADGQPCIQSPVQGNLEPRHVARGHGSRYQWNGLLFGGQFLRDWKFFGRRRWRHRIMGTVLIIGDLLQPIHTLAVDRAGHGQVSHGARGCGTVPMIDARRADDHVARMDFLYRPAPFLGQADTGDHHQTLACRMGMPG